MRARVVSKENVRHTPAGIPVLSLQVEHRSTLAEAGHKRDINLILDCVVIGEHTKHFEQLPSGSELQLTGFLANRSNKSSWVVFHINEFEEIAGDRNESI